MLPRICGADLARLQELEKDLRRAKAQMHPLLHLSRHRAQRISLGVFAGLELSRPTACEHTFVRIQFTDSACLKV